MITGFKSVQDRAVAMAKDNAESAVALVEKVAKSQSFQELLTLQVRFGQEHLQTFTSQMQELQALIEEALQKAAHG